MRKLIAILPIVFGLIALNHSQAGQMVAAADDGKEVKETKETKAVVPETCFNDHELQLDIFGQYAVGEGPNQAGVMRDHGWGGGVGVNYFFWRYIGVGIDGAWMDVKESPAQNRNERFLDRGVALNSFSGNLIFRFPIENPPLCLAPYVYVGGGYYGDGLNWGAGDVGVGVEWRIQPHKCSVFLDQRWTYLGDRNGERNLNFFSSRIGVRFIFF
jgi:hypothetical protein